MSGKLKMIMNTFSDYHLIGLLKNIFALMALGFLTPTRVGLKMELKTLMKISI